MANRLRGSQLLRAPRRSTAWGVGPSTGADGESRAASSSSSLLANTGVVPAIEGLTLVRIRGDLSVFLTTAGSAADGFNGAFGIGIATTRAFTSGVGALPIPLTNDEDEDWLYHRYFSLFAGGPIAVATAAQQADQVNATSAAARFEVDSKAMRKWAAGHTLYAALEVIETGVATMEWAFNSRILVKLP